MCSSGYCRTQLQPEMSFRRRAVVFSTLKDMQVRYASTFLKSRRVGLGMWFSWGRHVHIIIT